MVGTLVGKPSPVSAEMVGSSPTASDKYPNDGPTNKETPTNVALSKATVVADKQETDSNNGKLQQTMLVKSLLTLESASSSNVHPLTSHPHDPDPKTVASAAVRVAAASTPAAPLKLAPPTNDTSQAQPKSPQKAAPASTTVHSSSSSSSSSSQHSRSTTTKSEKTRAHADSDHRSTVQPQRSAATVGPKVKKEDITREIEPSNSSDASLLVSFSQTRQETKVASGRHNLKRAASESLPENIRNKKMKPTECILFAAALLEAGGSTEHFNTRQKSAAHRKDARPVSIIQTGNCKAGRASSPNPSCSSLEHCEEAGGLISTPRENDVLCGRGGGVNKHSGNIVYRKVVDYNKPFYQRLHKRYRNLVSQSIVQSILNHGGRFLITNGRQWNPIDFRRAVQKTSQALRERPPSLSSNDEKESFQSGVGNMVAEKSNG